MSEILDIPEEIFQRKKIYHWVVLSQEEWRSSEEDCGGDLGGSFTTAKYSALEPWGAMDGKGRQRLSGVASRIKFCTKWEAIKADFKHNN